jgi:hypothetical protein
MITAPGDPLVLLAVACLLLFAALAAIDGVYIHLCALRLHARPDSYGEHLWHTASALLFVPFVALFLAPRSTSGMLWLGLAVLAAIHVVEVLDVRAERESRRALGGLSRVELGIHVAALGTRTLGVAAVLALRPLDAWMPGAEGPAASLPVALSSVGTVLLPGAIAIAMLHLVLAIRHCPVCRIASEPS